MKELSMATARISWACWPPDMSKVGTQETVDAGWAAELVHFGNAIYVGSQQDKDIKAAQKSNPDYARKDAPAVSEPVAE